MESRVLHGLRKFSTTELHIPGNLHFYTFIITYPPYKEIKFGIHVTCTCIGFYRHWETRILLFRSEMFPGSLCDTDLFPRWGLLEETVTQDVRHRSSGHQRHGTAAHPFSLSCFPVMGWVAVLYHNSTTCTLSPCWATLPQTNRGLNHPKQWGRIMLFVNGLSQVSVNVMGSWLTQKPRHSKPLSLDLQILLYAEF